MTRPRDWHPLAEHDPVPGDPYEVRRLAQRFADTATAIRTAVDTLNEIHDSGTVWESEAGREFKTKTRDTADTIDKAFRRYDEASGALSTYATKLEQVQGDADNLLTRARQAQQDLEDAERSLGQAEPEQQSGREGDVADAEGSVAALQRDLEPIRQDWDDAGKQAADAIDDVVGDDGLKDGFWDNFLGFVEDLTELMGKLSAIFGVLALICTFVPFLQPFAALFGALAFVTGLISLAGNLLLLANGRATLGDVLWDLVGVVSFGAGRAFQLGARTMVKVARGLAKPAFIQVLRRGGTSFRQAKRIARARSITGGGREAKQLSRAYRRGEVSWLPKGAQWRTAFTRPFTDINPATFDLPADIAALGPVRVALRHSQYASATAISAGVAGNVGDGVALGPLVLPEGAPIVGADPAPVERNR